MNDFLPERLVGVTCVGSSLDIIEQHEVLSKLVASTTIIPDQLVLAAIIGECSITSKRKCEEILFSWP